MDTRGGSIRRRECANLHRFFTKEAYLGPSNTKPKKIKPPPVRDSWGTTRMLHLVKKHNGNKAAAAAEMGVAPATFYYRYQQIKENESEPDTEEKL